MATKAELTTGSASAATEHTEEPQLAELVTQEAGLSTEIELKVIRNDLVRYTYTYKGSQVTTQKVQIVLQSKQAEQSMERKIYFKHGLNGNCQVLFKLQILLTTL